MLQVNIIKNWQNLKISFILTLFDLQLLKLTFKQQNLHFWNQQAICNKKKYYIDIFNLQGLRAPVKPKKKN
jgi:hypothetical protein